MLSHILSDLADGPGEPGEICPSPDLLDGAIQVIMKGEAKPEQIAALLMGLRCRGERPEHLSTVVGVMLRNAVVFPGAGEQDMLFDTCGPGGIGRSTVNISTATALLAAAAGVPVAKHGNRSVSSRSGSADVLEALGVKIDCSPAISSRLLNEQKFCFLFAPLYHPSMKHAGPTRREIKIRSIFNLAGPLSNPALPTHQLVGVGDRKLLGLMVDTLKLLGRKRALVVHGRNGMDEISLTQVTEGFHLRADGKIEEIVIRPEDLGLKMIEMADLVVESPKDSAAKIRDVLDGKPGPISDQIIANAGAVLWLAGRAHDLRQGVLLAQEVQRSGKGADILDAVAEETNKG